MINNLKLNRFLFISAALSCFAISTEAMAQGMNNSAWSPQPANRASIAALIKQVEDGSSSNSAIGFAGSAGVTQLICGANTGEGTESSSNAQANSSCIILNNSHGALNINQESDGDQESDATSTNTTIVDETIIGANSGADEILATLNGE